MNSGACGDHSADSGHSISGAFALHVTCEEKVPPHDVRRETQDSRNLARRSVHAAYSIGDKQRQWAPATNWRPTVVDTRWPIRPASVSGSQKPSVQRDQEQTRFSSRRASSFIRSSLTESVIS